MRFGVFISPIHEPTHDPTIMIERDLQMVEDLDHFGYDEVWIGEHHSTGWEMVGSPEVFLAAAAQRTERIMLGSGVVSLPNHNPFNSVTRMVLVDHLSRGRAIFGVGPGALAQDTMTFGNDPGSTREFLLEGARVVQELLAGKSVTAHTDWFKLDDARLQLFPYRGRQMEMAVTAAVSASGPRTAGQVGAAMLSLAATQGPATELLARHWEIYSEEAEKAGHVPNRDSWRLLGPMFVAPTREEAIAAVTPGVDAWVHYMVNLSTLPFDVDDSLSTRDKIDLIIESGLGVIGTPDDAVAQIRRLEEASGGFGTYLFWANDWASPEDTRRSYELFATEVATQFQGQIDGFLNAQDRAFSTKKEDKETDARIRAEATARYEASRSASR